MSRAATGRHRHELKPLGSICGWGSFCDRGSIWGRVEWFPSAHGKPSSAIRHAGARRRLWDSSWVFRWRSANRMVAISAVAIVLATTAASASTASPSPLPHSTLVVGAIFSL